MPRRLHRGVAALLVDYADEEQDKTSERSAPFDVMIVPNLDLVAIS